MALCRCVKHGWPKGRNGREYVASVEPVGYPDTAVICGLSNCDEPGLIWLDEGDLEEYYKGERVFTGSSNFTKVKAKDSPLVLKGGTVS